MWRKLAFYATALTLMLGAAADVEAIVESVEGALLRASFAPTGRVSLLSFAGMGDLGKAALLAGAALLGYGLLGAGRR